MKTILLTIAAILSVLALRPSSVQSGSLVLAEFPASSLKWVHIAEPIFQQRKLELDKYTITVIDEGDTITVIANEAGLSDKVRGSGGKYPAYEVQISKKDEKVVDAHYDR
jgi:hypothetical protein